MTSTHTKTQTQTQTRPHVNTRTPVPTPSQFLCPLTKKIMKDPLMSRYGTHFERSAILQWLDEGNMFCPVTRKPLRQSNLITDKRLRLMIRTWQMQAAGCDVSSNGNKSNPDTNNGSKGPSSKSPVNGLKLDVAEYSADFGLTGLDEKNNSDTAAADDKHDMMECITKRLGMAQITIVPDRFICPLTRRAMKDPVMTKTGVNYERAAILAKLQAVGCVCPVTRKPLAPSGVITNSKLHWEIRQWQQVYGPTRTSMPRYTAERDDKTKTKRTSQGSGLPESWGCTGTHETAQPTEWNDSADLGDVLDEVLETLRL